MQRAPHTTGTAQRHVQIAYIRAHCRRAATQASAHRQGGSGAVQASSAVTSCDQADRLRAVRVAAYGTMLAVGDTEPSHDHGRVYLWDLIKNRT